VSHTDVLTAPPPAVPTDLPDPVGPAWPHRRWLALTVLLAAGFMDLLDTTIVNVAIPSIREGLDADYASIQWLVAGYLLAVAVGLVTFGRLGDIVGRRRVFLLGVLGFGIASLACGLAPTPLVLVIARIFQGTCAAAMIPQILSSIQVSFPRAEQRRALAMYSTMAGVAVMSGPLLAGLLITELGLSWRTIFLVNVPVTVAVAVATCLWVPESSGQHKQRLDVGGSALVSLALFTLVFGLIEGREYGWPLWIVGMLIASPALFAAFAVYERRKERRGEFPLLPMDLFTQRQFSGGLVVVLVFFSGVVGFFLAFSIFLQLGLGFDAMQSALTTFPSSIGLVVASVASQKLFPRPSRVVLALGSLGMALALAVLLAVVTYQGGEVTAWEIRPVMFAFGLGMGVTLPSLADVIIGQVRTGDTGAASGIVNTGLQVGNAIGVALIGMVLFNSLAAHAPESAESASHRITDDLSSVGVPAGQQAGVVRSFTKCFVDGSRQQDPGATPESCRRQDDAAPTAQQSTMSAQVRRSVAAATEWARKDNFSAAIQHSLGYEVTVFGASFLLLLLLPTAARYLPRHKKSRGGRRASARSVLAARRTRVGAGPPRTPGDERRDR
jgi:EmrB/QacA subfamily drug resistance transporter